MKPNLRRIDRDVLVPLRLQGVHEIRPLERHTPPLRDLLQLLQLAFGQRPGVMKQPAYERGLSMVHVPHNHDFQLFSWSADVHLPSYITNLTCVTYLTPSHIYPSRRSFSKASSLSLSCARPARSGTLVWRSSSMIS